MRWKLLLLCVILLGALAYILYAPFTAQGQPGEMKQITSASEADAHTIVTDLYKQGIIKSKLSIPILLGLNTVYKKIRSGSYTLSKNMSLWQVYSQLASPSARWIKIQEGLRKEEVATVLGKNLGWDKSKQTQFINAHTLLKTENLEGHYFPESYLLPVTTSPVEVSKKMVEKYNDAVIAKKPASSRKIINEETALIIASIIQREAAGASDMRLISGIIWNRVFDGMNLDIDATLQYAKGSAEAGWWPQVQPKDKKIDSPYNTYTHKGLPPGPISNPGLAAIEAAYNPQKTNCIFYLHDKNRKIHCSETYTEHKNLIDIYY